MYIIKKTDKKITCVNDPAWETANVANVNLINWKEFDQCPETMVRILYSDYGIHVLMQTDENLLVAKRRQQNSDVCNDSCMEFFFRPNENDARYMNFEFNPFATMYYGVRTDRYHFVTPPEDKDFFEAVSHIDEKVWKMQFSIPFAYIDKIFGCHTKTMYGNLYKCGSETAYEHYATYYPISSEKPDFHRPEAFGVFVLE